MTMFKKALRNALLGAAVSIAAIGGAQAAEGVAAPKNDWSFSGVFGTFDKAAAQRGLQVYSEVCSGCHSLHHVYYRNITELGYTDDQAKSFAAQFETTDGPNDDGDMFTRAALPSDHFVSPFANEKAAAASNGGKAPPDLSLMVKARMGGADYIVALLLGYDGLVSKEGLDAAMAAENHRRHAAYERAMEEYEDAIDSGKDATKPEEPKEVKSISDFGIPAGGNFNAYFPGYAIAMAAPLSDDMVEYADGTPATAKQMAHDVATFLAWTAEPEMEARKGMGVKVFLFLLVFLGLAIANKKRIWAKLH